MSALMTAVVELKPDLAKFKRATVDAVQDVSKDAGKKLEQGLGDAGGKAGKRVGDGLADGMSYDKNGKLRDARGRFVQTSEQMGEEAGQKAATKFTMGWDKLNSIGNKMTLGITLPAIAAAKVSLDAFSRFQDASSAAGVFYGEQASQIEQFAKRAATGYGMSRVAVLELANGLNPLISQFTAADQQGTTAVEAMKRVGDMASFFGGSVEEAATAVQSFLSGSSVEPIRRYGVFASEAAVQAKALSMGLVQANVSSAQLSAAQSRLADAQAKANEATRKYGAGSDEARRAVANVGLAEEALAKVTEGKIPVLTEQQKIQARYALLLEQTNAAQGDFKRTSDSLANSQKASTAQMQNAAITLGQKLAPTMIKVLNALTKLINTFTHLPGVVQDGILVMVGIAAAAGPIIKIISLVRSLIAAYTALRSAALASAAAQGVASAAGGGAGAAGGAGLLARFAPGAAAAVPYAAAALAGAYAGGKAGNYLYDHSSGYKSFIEGVAKVPVLGQALRGVGWAFSKLPGMAEGGTTVRPGLSWVGEKGKELVHLPAGAQVIPHRQSMDLTAGAAPSYTTYVSMQVTVDGKGFDERSLAQHLDSLARRAAATNTRTARPVR